MSRWYPQVNNLVNAVLYTYIGYMQVCRGSYGIFIIFIRDKYHKHT